ncbi:MAG TPA: Crp/Fnr family transcriptional regulator [Segetibacter sp.]|jgi:CRP-like cAMP-binding protein
MNQPHHDHLLEAIKKFIKIDDREWQLLEPHLYEKKLKKHEYFAEQGKVAKDIGFVLNGNMRHYYTHDGEEKTTYFYFENHFVAAYISCITNTPSQLTIQALTECELLVFPYAIMKKLYEQSHTWERFGRLLAEYLATGLEERMAGLLLLSPEERYKQLLEGNKDKILERIPQHYIASYLGITPVSLSRIRNRR